MKNWQKGALTATFLAAGAFGAAGMLDLKVTGDLNGTQGTYTYDLKRNPLADQWQKTPFVFSTDAGNRIDMFLDRNVDASKADPWVHVPNEVSNLRLKTTLGPVTLKTEEVSRTKAKQVNCDPQCP